MESYNEFSPELKQKLLESSLALMGLIDMVGIEQDEEVLRNILYKMANSTEELREVINKIDDLISEEKVK